MKQLFGLGALFLIISFSCENNKESGSAKIRVALIDAPGNYESVLIDIVDVQINMSTDENDENGWQSLESAQPDIYDLLLLTNGEEAFLGEIELPEGKLGQVRLILGDGNKLKVDGQTLELTVPSGSQSGLKLNVNATIEGGFNYKLIIDFDAAKSVVKAGNSGKYNLKPVVRASMEATTGAIEGFVSPREVASVVWAIAGQDSISSYPNENGQFQIRALAEGTYTVSAVPTEIDTLSSASIENILVEIGVITQIDTLKFN